MLKHQSLEMIVAWWKCSLSSDVYGVKTMVLFDGYNRRMEEPDFEDCSEVPIISRASRNDIDYRRSLRKDINKRWASRKDP
jgi:hypothetical protein